MSRVRLRFTKLGKVRFTSHRDVARMWERALRRAALPLAYTEGFSPRPKVHFGLALSTGHESLGEYIDVDLRDGEPLPTDIEGLSALLTPLLPDGIDVVASAETPSIGATSLQQAVTACSWQIEVGGLTPTEVDDAIARLLDADTLPVVRERKGKQVSDDLRPALLQLSRGAGSPQGDEDTTAPVVVSAELGTQPRAVRPSELLGVLDARAVERRVLRTHQWITTGAEPVEPLVATVPPPPTGASVRREPSDDRTTDRRGPPGHDHTRRRPDRDSALLGR